MTFEEAIRQSMKAYRKGKRPEEAIKAGMTFTYTMEFFDKMEKDLLSKSKSKGKASDEEAEMEAAE